MFDWVGFEEEIEMGEERDRRHGLYEWFRFVQDTFYPINKWPKHLRDRMLKRHKSNHDRYVLWVFLVWNGVRPADASLWVLSERVSNDGQRLVIGDYDNVARRQVFFQLPKMLEEKKLGPRNMKVFDFSAGTGKGAAVPLGDLGY